MAKFIALKLFLIAFLASLILLQQQTDGNKYILQLGNFIEYNFLTQKFTQLAAGCTVYRVRNETCVAQSGGACQMASIAQSYDSCPPCKANLIYHFYYSFSSAKLISVSLSLS